MLPTALCYPRLQRPKKWDPVEKGYCTKVHRSRLFPKSGMPPFSPKFTQTPVSAEGAGVTYTGCSGHVPWNLLYRRRRVFGFKRTDPPGVNKPPAVRRVRDERCAS
jgi:hypothetical protein